MGRPVVHFEVIGKDAAALQKYYAELFAWNVDANNPMNYGLVAREDNLNSDGIGIGGGIGSGPEGSEGHVIFYVEVDDVEAALQKAERLGRKRLMGPHTMDEPPITLGHFADPEGHVIGLLGTAS